jgi:hypothetical protein
MAFSSGQEVGENYLIGPEFWSPAETVRNRLPWALNLGAR